MAAVIWWTADNIKQSHGWVVTEGPWIDLGLCYEGSIRYESGGLSPVVEMNWRWRADRTLTATLIAVDIPDYGTSFRRLNAAATVNPGDILDIKWTTEG